MLSWTPGEFAVTHDVYFGTSFSSVSDASIANPLDVLVGKGQDASTFDPAKLDFGTTYFWRVDEVNGAPDNTVYKGDVWSFTTEPVGYPVTNVTATASSFSKDMEPGHTVDGSGLTGDQHSTLNTAMWLTGDGTVLPAWIQYEFDQVLKLHELWVWNSNQNIEGIIGFGAKDVTIEYSLDGAAWSTLRDQVFDRASGGESYPVGAVVDMAGVQAKFVRLTIKSNWGGKLEQTGLSEVRFFYIPVQARAPQPASGATDVAVDSVLSWRAGREAVTHQVYLSTDEQAVIDGTAPVEVVTERRFTPAAMEYGQVYYWKVNEANEAATPSLRAGDVWSFSTQDYVIVDDFESYANNSPNRLFQTWIDGLGFSPDDFFPQGNSGNGTGAIVGYDPMQGNVAETNYRQERQAVHAADLRQYGRRNLGGSVHVSGPGLDRSRHQEPVALFLRRSGQHRTIVPQDQQHQGAVQRRRRRHRHGEMAGMAHRSIDRRRQLEQCHEADDRRRRRRGNRRRVHRRHPTVSSGPRVHHARRAGQREAAGATTLRATPTTVPATA